MKKVTLTVLLISIFAALFYLKHSDDILERRCKLNHNECQ